MLISDLFEGGAGDQMLARMAALKAAGVQVIVLLALSDDGAPAFDKDDAAALAGLGVPAFACTPDAFPDLLATAIEGGDLAAWAHRQDRARAVPAAADRLGSWPAIRQPPGLAGPGGPADPGGPAGPAGPAPAPAGWFVLVAGWPASGKSTLARALAAELGLPLLAKDEIKEALMDGLRPGRGRWRSPAAWAGRPALAQDRPGAGGGHLWAGGHPTARGRAGRPARPTAWYRLTVVA